MNDEAMTEAQTAAKKCLESMLRLENELDDLLCKVDTLQRLRKIRNTLRI